MSGAGESFGLALAQLFRLVFSPMFPLTLVTACAVSFVLVFVFQLPQFALLAYLASLGFSYAQDHLWAGLAMLAFVVGSFPLAWIAFKEHAIQASGAVGHWILFALATGLTAWVVIAWPFDGSDLQEGAFAILLFATWAGFGDAVLSTLKIVALNRPRPGPEVVRAQKAHGDAQVAGEAEALALLRSKK